MVAVALILIAWNERSRTCNEQHLAVVLEEVTVIVLIGYHTRIDKGL